MLRKCCLARFSLPQCLQAEPIMVKVEVVDGQALGAAYRILLKVEIV